MLKLAMITAVSLEETVVVLKNELALPEFKFMLRL